MLTNLLERGKNPSIRFALPNRFSEIEDKVSILFQLYFYKIVSPNLLISVLLLVSSLMKMDRLWIYDWSCVMHRVLRELLLNIASAKTITCPALQCCSIVKNHSHFVDVVVQMPLVFLFLKNIVVTQSLLKHGPHSQLASSNNSTASVLLWQKNS